ncbi:MAG: hypothetical protein JRC90_11570 [Deltaproteobacteria bacterium]|nr:hypothetical protein [Deltaproteobacteria bacterium]
MMKSCTWADTLELKADVGKSILVKDIFVTNTSDAYLIVKIDRTTVGYFRVDNDKLGNLLHFPLPDSEKKTLLGYLGEKGLFGGYPVAEGQTFELSGLDSGKLTAVVLYDEYDAGDITPSMENGTESDTLVYVSFGRSKNVINTTGEHLLDVCVNPSEFPAFPFGADVPAKTEIDVLGMLACERAADDGTTPENYIKTRYYKLMRGREILFDPDRKGILAYANTIGSGGAFECENGYSLLGEYSSTAQRPPFLFPEGFTFVSGEELLVYMITEVGSTPGQLELDEQEVGFILRMRKVE